MQDRQCSTGGMTCGTAVMNLHQYIELSEHNEMKGSVEPIVADESLVKSPSVECESFSC